MFSCTRASPSSLSSLTPPRPLLRALVSKITQTGLASTTITYHTNSFILSLFHCFVVPLCLYLR